MGCESSYGIDEIGREMLADNSTGVYQSKEYGLMPCIQLLFTP